MIIGASYKYLRDAEKRNAMNPVCQRYCCSTRKDTYRMCGRPHPEVRKRPE